MPKPFIDVKSVELVRVYKKKGLNISEIARVMKKDRKTIYRWYYFSEGNTKYIHKLR